MAIKQEHYVRAVVLEYLVLYFFLAGIRTCGYPRMNYLIKQHKKSAIAKSTAVVYVSALNGRNNEAGLKKMISKFQETIYH